MASSANITTNDLTHWTKQCEKQRSWGIWEHFNRLTGWRKSAFINTILVFAVLLVLISLHVVVWAKSGSLDGSQIIYSGSCLGNSVGRLNTFLHLLINILSSLVLASTNFFMQVLIAPSRAELDRAHEKGNWLDIGVPSPRNAFRVSKFKTIMWLLFFLSSIPIHLLFNSVIFLTDHRDANFSYFVFDESISTGVAVFDPGASLSIPLQDLMGDFESDDYDFNTKIWRNKTTLGISRNTFFETAHVNRSRTIQTTVQAISNGTWHKLDISTCKSIYKTDSCSGLRKYRNVAIILSGSSGWNRSQLWDLPADESSFWDAHVPSSENNALWFAEVSEENDSNCLMKIETVLADSGNDMINHCYNRCSYSMGLHSNESDVLSYQLFGTGITIASVSTRPQFDNSSLGIEYCLAEPLDTVCQIGLASTLLLCVSFWQGSFGQDAGNNTISFPQSFTPSFEMALFIANAPQLFLSFAYLAYNSLFTRLHMAKEWSAMSTRYKGLRVTYPMGQQSSTYFLQLPYRYSVPLIIISITLHWVLSGCIYLLVMQGEYFAQFSQNGPLSSFTALGFSTKSIFVMLTLELCLIFIPPIFGFIRLPPNSIVVGSNSFAISASCHISPLVGQSQPQPNRSSMESSRGHQDDGIELRHLMAPSPGPSPLGSQKSEGWKDEEEWKATLLRVSQSRIRWGVVNMPPSWSEQFVKRETEVEHISFGLPEDDVQPPAVGHWYA
ncbi:uncharacterized protein J7T55_005676 [Diaporthe amygdali]|uniref:uncharacterized protein n=1 Tax=Phomopsis amygdali TaxID=1214568 RepID=UPI0022FDC218|nr:uncharacterized protein J7T55_005676 [Diaporthe amygdali]KAJ0124338.1 uncharacterized protein J7T55_005676 [Diaporthe amygdali]